LVLENGENGLGDEGADGTMPSIIFGLKPPLLFGKNGTFFCLGVALCPLQLRQCIHRQSAQITHQFNIVVIAFVYLKLTNVKIRQSKGKVNK